MDWQAEVQCLDADQTVTGRPYAPARMALSKQHCVRNQQHRPGWVSTGRAVNMLSESVKGSAGDFRRSSQMRGMSGDGHKGAACAQRVLLSPIRQAWPSQRWRSGRARRIRAW